MKAATLACAGLPPCVSSPKRELWRGSFGDLAAVGFGTTQESLAVAQSPGAGTLSGDSLTGELTFTYTPAAAPEVSTWAMMLVGFAGVGYVLVRCKPAHRSVQA